jgi:hypothetical protein
MALALCVRPCLTWRLILHWPRVHFTVTSTGIFGERVYCLIYATRRVGSYYHIWANQWHSVLPSRRVRWRAAARNQRILHQLEWTLSLLLGYL